MDKIQFENELICLYETWLIENYADEIICKDNLIEKSENGFKRDEFLKEVNEVLGC